MSKSKILKIGIFGAGRIGFVHANAIQKNVDNAYVKTIADPFMDQKRKDIFSKLGIENVIQSIDDVFNDSEIDIIYICTPTNTHKDLIIRALKANKHVFSEKPLSLKLNEIIEIQNVYKESKKMLMVGMNRRFDKNFMAVKKQIDSQEIGKVLSIHITSRDPGLPPMKYLKASGGLFVDMMIHDLDMMRFLNPSPIVSVMAAGEALLDPDVKNIANDVDTASVILKFQDGSLGIINNCRFTSYGYDQRVEVHGTKSTVSIGNDTNTKLIISNGKGITSEKPFEFFLERYKEAYISESKSFINSIQNNIVTETIFNDGLLSVVLAEAAKKSLQENRVVKLSEIYNAKNN